MVPPTPDSAHTPDTPDIPDTPDTPDTRDTPRAHAAPSGAGGRARRRVRSVVGGLATLAVAVLAATFLWPPRSVGAQGDLDSSWKWVLTAAHGNHLRFGHDFVFTYGPLGWLFSPVAASWRQLVAATAVAAVGLVAGLLALRFLLRRALPPVVCDVVVLALAAVVGAGSPELLATMGVLVVLACLAGVRHRPGLVEVAVAGLVGGAALSTKFGVGELLVAVGLPLAVAWSRSLAGLVGRVAVWAVGVAAGFGAAWYGSGQRTSDIAGFVRGSAEIQRGYQTAMVFDAPGRAWEAVGDGVAFALLVVAALVVIARARGNRLRAAMAAVAALIGTYYELLQAYVRHDSIHDVAGQGMTVLIAVGFLAGSAAFGRPAAVAAAGRPATDTAASAESGTRAGARGTRIGRVLHAGVAVLCAAAFLATFIASSPDSFDTFNPPSRIQALRHDAQRIADPARQRAVVQRAWAGLRRTDPYPAPIVAALRGKKVIPVPWDIDGPAAFGAIPVTLPVPQTYSAYTAYLDRLNTTALLRPGSPPVLRRTVFARGAPNPMWESPLFITTLVCNYADSLALGRYQILTRSTQRCAVSDTVLRSESVRAGQLVTVPRPAHAGDGVTMTITAHPSPAARLITRVAREPHAWMVRVDGRLVFRMSPLGVSEPMVVVMPPGLWSAGTFVGGDDSTLRFTGVPRLTVTFTELVRTGS